MTAETDVTAKVYPLMGSDGLHRAVLSPMETLAQSVSAVAPSATPSMTVPLVFAIAGNGTWFVYLLSTVAMLLVGLCVSRFAKMSSSPGSLYTYTADTLAPGFGAVSAWALLLAYVMTGCSVAAGALFYTDLLAQRFLGLMPPAALVLAIVALGTGLIAWRDVKLSAEMMLWIEVCSVSCIAVVVVLLLVRRGLHPDLGQLTLKGVSFPSLGPALVLAMFSFVGFESATSLGTEAREPLKTIPRAVLQCVTLAGIFFILCAYGEVLGFHGEAARLSDATSPDVASPLHILARKAGVSKLGAAIDVGAWVSMMACVLACTTAASRIVLRMAATGLLPDGMGKTHPKNGTPVAGVALVSGAIMLLTVGLSLRGVSAWDMYGWLGSISVFGFLTAYALVAIALPFARKAQGQHSLAVIALSGLTVLVMAGAMVGCVYPVPDGPARWFPYLYGGYILAGMSWYGLRRGNMLGRSQ